MSLIWNLKSFAELVGDSTKSAFPTLSGRHFTWLLCSSLFEQLRLLIDQLFDLTEYLTFGGISYENADNRGRAVLNKLIPTETNQWQHKKSFLLVFTSIPAEYLQVWEGWVFSSYPRQCFKVCLLTSRNIVNLAHEISIIIKVWPYVGHKNCLISSLICAYWEPTCPVET